jgi:hypothetical protein
MKRNFATVLSFVFLLIGAFVPIRAFAAVPTTLTQQGRLLNTDGTPVSGPVRMIFNIYASSSSTTPLWTETQSNVMLESGAFSVQLGSMTPFPGTLWNGQTVYLGVTVGNDPEMTPREQITSVPYALMCAQADHATNSDALGGVSAASYALGSQLTGGTVTSVASGAGLTGGPITTSGTLSVVFAGGGSANSAAHSDHVHNGGVHLVASAAATDVYQACDSGIFIGGSCDPNAQTGVTISRFAFVNSSGSTTGTLNRVHCSFSGGSGYANALCLTIAAP